MATKEGRHFLEVLTRYVDWRIKGKRSDPKPEDPSAAFRAFLLSRGATRKSEAFQSMAARMRSMKDSRGPQIPPPEAAGGAAADD